MLNPWQEDDEVRSYSSDGGRTVVDFLLENLYRLRLGFFLVHLLEI